MKKLTAYILVLILAATCLVGLSACSKGAALSKIIDNTVAVLCNENTHFQLTEYPNRSRNSFETDTSVYYKYFVEGNKCLKETHPSFAGVDTYFELDGSLYEYYTNYDGKMYKRKKYHKDECSTIGEYILNTTTLLATAIHNVDQFYYESEEDVYIFSTFISDTQYSVKITVENGLITKYLEESIKGSTYSQTMYLIQYEDVPVVLPNEDEVIIANELEIIGFDVSYNEYLDSDIISWASPRYSNVRVIYWVDFIIDGTVIYSVGMSSSDNRCSLRIADYNFTYDKQNIGKTCTIRIISDCQFHYTYSVSIPSEHSYVIM